MTAPQNGPRREEANELVSLRAAHELLMSTLDAVQDGVVTRQLLNDIVFFNKRFAEIWGIPLNQRLTRDAKLLNEHMANRVKNPDDLLARIEVLRSNPETEDLNLVELKDNRILERRVMPQRANGKCIGSVITFRDITDERPADPRIAALRGARILLVEDNDINQQVARELLESIGLVVQVADNGQVRPSSWRPACRLTWSSWTC